MSRFDLIDAIDDIQQDDLRMTMTSYTSWLIDNQLTYICRAVAKDIFYRAAEKMSFAEYVDISAERLREVVHTCSPFEGVNTPETLACLGEVAEQAASYARTAATACHRSFARKALEDTLSDVYTRRMDADDMAKLRIRVRHMKPALDDTSEEFNTLVRQLAERQEAIWLKDAEDANQLTNVARHVMYEYVIRADPGEQHSFEHLPEQLQMRLIEQVLNGLPKKVEQLSTRKSIGVEQYLLMLQEADRFKAQANARLSQLEQRM